MISRQYLAGFFDGEGCVSMGWSKRDKRWNCSLIIELKRETRNAKLLSGFCQHYNVKLGTSSRAYRMEIRRKAMVLKFIEDVLPYSTLKKTQLLLLKSYLEDPIYGYRISQQLKSHKRRD